ncbi:MAG TPA: hypothetical protein VIT43_02595 [Candidatus Dormibacteraeota bacterium]
MKGRSSDRRIKLSDAARKLHCHVETLRIRVRDGRLKATRGRHGAYYVSAEELANLRPPGKRPKQPVVSLEDIEEAWDRGERFLESNRNAFARELKLYRMLRRHPDRQPRLYRLLSVNRLHAIGLPFSQIAEMVGITPRHARRLAKRRPLDALRRDLATIRSHRVAAMEARLVVNQLRRALEERGFRYHRRPVQPNGDKMWRAEPKMLDDPEPAYKVKKLTHDEVRALRHAGLSEDQIEAVSLVGMGADEVNELMLRGIDPRVGSRR